MYVIDCTSLHGQYASCRELVWHTIMTGQRSRAEMYAKEVLSDVEYSAIDVRLVGFVDIHAYGSLYRTPSCSFTEICSREKGEIICSCRRVSRFQCALSCRGLEGHILPHHGT